MVLHRERGDIRKRDALSRSVIEVYMRKPDPSKALVFDKRRDMRFAPEAQVARMLIRTAAFVCDKRAETWEHQIEPVVLGGDLNASGEQIHHRVVPTMMAEFQLLDAAACCLADHLMSHADAEHGNLSEDLPDLLVCIFYGIGIARPVRDEHTIG